MPNKIEITWERNAEGIIQSVYSLNAHKSDLREIVGVLECVKPDIFNRTKSLTIVKGVQP